MLTTTGVFKSRAEAEQAAGQLRALGISRDRIITLTPQVSERELERVRTTQGEQPGMVTAMGAVAGGAVGMGVVEALAIGLIPGVGPIAALGLAGGALIGALTGGV